jgi:hypothetical protein
LVGGYGHCILSCWFLEQTENIALQAAKARLTSYAEDRDAHADSVSRVLESIGAKYHADMTVAHQRIAELEVRWASVQHTVSLVEFHCTHDAHRLSSASNFITPSVWSLNCTRLCWNCRFLSDLHCCLMLSHLVCMSHVQPVGITCL